MIKFNFQLWPEQASTFAKQVDDISIVLTLLTIFFTTLVMTLLLFLAIRYRRGSKVDRSNPVNHHLMLELTWSIIPLILGLIMFAWAAMPYASVYKPPANAQEIYVVGKRWMWHLQHADNGIREMNELHVPVGQPFKLTLISQDVIHGFYIPAFRVKRDAIPGAYNTCWFEATQPGKYYLFCTEYCGTNHSQMGGWIYVMTPSDYSEWVSKGGRKSGDEMKTVISPEQNGEALFRRYACGNCHGAADGVRAPSLMSLYGKQRTFLDGKTVTADRSYIRQAIISPEDNLLKGYGAVSRMPNYRGQLSEDDINQLIAYIKSLGGDMPSAKATSATKPTGQNKKSRKQQ